MASCASIIRNIIHYYPRPMLFLVLDIGKSVTLLLLLFVLVYPLMGGLLSKFERLQGALYGWTHTVETPTLTHDRQLVGERVSKNERDLAVFLGATAYFWSVKRVKGDIICDFISFHSGKGEVSVISDSWS